MLLSSSGDGLSGSVFFLSDGFYKDLKKLLWKISSIGVFRGLGFCSARVSLSIEDFKGE